MSEKRQAIFIRDKYFLLPDGCASAEEFVSGLGVLPASAALRALTENNNIPSGTLEKGVCIAPYFYSEYGFEEIEVTVDDPGEVFPVEVELFTQEEYNERLRGAVNGFCPGCVGFKPLSNKPQSLNGHFEELTLNSVCFYRQENKPRPRVFRSGMLALGRLMCHFDPTESTAEDLLQTIKETTYLKYNGGEWLGGEKRILRVAFTPDLFPQCLTDVLSRFCSTSPGFTPFSVRPKFMLITGGNSVRDQLDPENAESFRKNCRKYGVALAELRFDPAFGERVTRSLTQMEERFFHSVVSRENGKLSLLVLDECGFLKELHFRSPLMQAADAHVRVYDKDGEKGFRISFDMERE